MNSPISGDKSRSAARLKKACWRSLALGNKNPNLRTQLLAKNRAYKVAINRGKSCLSVHFGAAQFKALKTPQSVISCGFAVRVGKWVGRDSNPQPTP